MKIGKPFDSLNLICIRKLVFPTRQIAKYTPNSLRIRYVMKKRHNLKSKTDNIKHIGEEGKIQLPTVNSLCTKPSKIY